MSQTITVPNEVIDAYHFAQDNWQIALAVVVVAILSSIFVEVVKRKHNKKQLEDMSKKAVAWLLVVFSTLFTVLGYIIFFIQANTSFLASIPVIGQHVTEALGVAYLLYNVRLNKTYKNVALWASKWSKKDKVPEPVTTVTPQPQPELTPIVPTEEETFA